MDKDKIVIVDRNAGSLDNNSITKENHASNFKRLVKLFFGSQSIWLVSISLMALAVMNGNVVGSFTHGLVNNLGDFLSSIFGGMTYPIAMIIGGVMLLGPLHVYVMENSVDLIIVILITFFITAFLLGHMFKHPLWAFLGGFAVMTSFVISVTSLIGIVGYVTDELIGFNISSILYMLIEGIFDIPSTEMFLYTILENGAILGLFGILWCLILSPRHKNDETTVYVKCGDESVCKV